MWTELGFKENPYDSRPLRITPDDAELLVGRQSESMAFFTILDSGEQGICVISGLPGVGKTSFLNVQQYYSATGMGTFGPRLLPMERPCTIMPGDEVGPLARRVVETAIKSVEIECYSTRRTLPSETEKVQRWLRHGGATGGYNVGLTIAGFGGHFGREAQLPPVSEASFDSFCDALRAVVVEAATELGFNGIFMPLDNLENLSDEALAELLIAFRDTLFDIPGVWWVLIGQSGLGSLIQTTDPRVWEHVAGPAIELEPLELNALHEAIERRVERFSTGVHRKSPLPISMHAKLYEASKGELRYTLKKSTDICIEAVARIREGAYERAENVEIPDAGSFANRIAHALVDGQIPEYLAETTLQNIVSRELKQLGLTERERRALAKIAHCKEIRPRDFEYMGFRSGQDLYTTFISKFHNQGLLYRRQEGKPVYYGLRGIAAMAAEYNLLEQVNGGGGEAADESALYESEP